MIKNKYILMIILPLLFFSSLKIDIFAYDNNEVLKGYIKEIRQLDNDYYIFGKTVIQDIANESVNKSQLKKQAQFYLSEVNSIENRLSIYSNSFNENTREARETLLLLAALTYYKIGINELLALLEDESDLYEPLQYYFEVKFFAEQILDTIEKSINTK